MFYHRKLLRGFGLAYKDIWIPIISLSSDEFCGLGVVHTKELCSGLPCNRESARLKGVVFHLTLCPPFANVLFRSPHIWTNSSSFVFWPNCLPFWELITLKAAPGFFGKQCDSIILNAKYWWLARMRPQRLCRQCSVYHFACLYQFSGKCRVGNKRVW